MINAVLPITLRSQHPIMRPDAKVEKIYLYTELVDFRKSTDSPAVLMKRDIKGALPQGEALHSVLAPLVIFLVISEPPLIAKYDDQLSILTAANVKKYADTKLSKLNLLSVPL